MKSRTAPGTPPPHVGGYEEINLPFVQIPKQAEKSLIFTIVKILLDLLYSCRAYPRS